MNMRRKTIILLLAGFCVLPVGAQTAKEQQSDYDSFKKQALKEYSDYRKECLKEYADFVRRAWKDYVEKIPWRREWLPTPVFLLGESHEQRRLAGYSPWDRKKSDQLNNFHSEGSFQFR